MSVTDCGFDSGQASMEFMTYFGFALLVFALFAPMFLNQISEIDRFGGELEAERAATVIEEEINLAVKFGDGYNRSFRLPNKIHGANYTVDLDTDSRIISVDWNDGEQQRQLIAAEIEGDVEPGMNQLYNDENTIVLKQM